eukprot:3936639-Rhodomonas_salina.2
MVKAESALGQDGCVEHGGATAGTTACGSELEIVEVMMAPRDVLGSHVGLPGIREMASPTGLLTPGR